MLILINLRTIHYHFHSSHQPVSIIFKIKNQNYKQIIDFFKLKKHSYS
jgi:hypothetical protein